VKLLTDLRAVFGEHEKLFSENILERLHAIEESPWGDLRGVPLNARRLAGLLRQYGVGSTQVRIGDKSNKGYRREDLFDAWARYLPSTPAGNMRNTRNSTGTSRSTW
jgi:hypothetical protein